MQYHSAGFPQKISVCVFPCVCPLSVFTSVLQLQSLPETLSNAKELHVLNISYNQLQVGTATMAVEAAVQLQWQQQQQAVQWQQQQQAVQWQQQEKAVQWQHVYTNSSIEYLHTNIAEGLHVTIGSNSGGSSSSNVQL